MKKHAKKSKHPDRMIHKGKEILEKISEGVNPPGIQYHVGRRRGMQELANIARPKFQKLIDQERDNAKDAINALTAIFEAQYDTDINTLRKGTKNAIMMTTEGAVRRFLRALKRDEAADMGLDRGVLVWSADTGLPMYIIPTQKVLLDGKKGNHFVSFPANEIADDIMHKLGDRTALPDLNPLALPTPAQLLGNEVDIYAYLGEDIPQPQAQ